MLSFLKFLLAYINIILFEWRFEYINNQILIYLARKHFSAMGTCVRSYPNLAKIDVFEHKSVSITALNYARKKLM